MPRLWGDDPCAKPLSCLLRYFRVSRCSDSQSRAAIIYIKLGIAQEAWQSLKFNPSCARYKTYLASFNGVYNGHDTLRIIMLVHFSIFASFDFVSCYFSTDATTCSSEAQSQLHKPLQLGSLVRNNNNI